MTNEDRIHIHIVDDGYIVNPEYPSLSQKLSFGEIVRENLDMYYCQQSATLLDGMASSNNTNPSDRIKLLKKTVNLSRSGGIRKVLDESIKYLPLLMSDRETFLNRFSSNMSQSFSNSIEVRNTWDAKTKKIIQELYVVDLNDLLLYDIGMVIAKDIYICPCGYCKEYFIKRRKQEKYCPRHRKIGQDTTRINNFDKDPCRKLSKKIYNMLKNRVSGQQVKLASSVFWSALDNYTVENSDMRDKYRSGTITQAEYLSWLKKQEDKYRIYKKRKPNREIEGE